MRIGRRVGRIASGTVNGIHLQLALGNGIQHVDRDVATDVAVDIAATEG